jgi:hypothetical protein
MAISRITASGVATDTLTAADLAPNSVDSSELVDGSIDTSHIGDDQVTADKLANSINTDIAAGVAALPKAGGTMTGNIVMGDDTSIGISDSAERIEFDGAGDISILGANFGIGTSTPGALLDVAGGIVEQGGVLKENLITNSGFGVWSNSTLEVVTAHTKTRVSY